jgi:hypothetical protein
LNTDHTSINRLSSDSAGNSFASPESEVLPRADQTLYSGLISLATLTLAVARYVRPSANGYGTHQQLGLPPCVFFKLVGIPCPSCGLTTSFAHAARFHFYQALLTQPFGLVAFCLTVGSIPILVFLIRGRIPWREAIRTPRVQPLFYVLLVIYLLSWFYKIAIIKMTGFGS